MPPLGVGAGDVKSDRFTVKIIMHVEIMLTVFKK